MCLKSCTVTAHTDQRIMWTPAMLALSCDLIIINTKMFFFFQRSSCLKRIALTLKKSRCSPFCHFRFWQLFRSSPVALWDSSVSDAEAAEHPGFSRLPFYENWEFRYTNALQGSRVWKRGMLEALVFFHFCVRHCITEHLLDQFPVGVHSLPSPSPALPSLLALGIFRSSYGVYSGLCHHKW